MRTIGHEPRTMPEFEDERRHELSVAWLYAIGVVPAVGLAYVAAAVTFGLLNQDMSHAPAWADVIAWGVAIAVLAVPAVGALVHGQRARRWGYPAGIWPMLVGGGLGGAYVVAVLAYVIG